MAVARRSGGVNGFILVVFIVESVFHQPPPAQHQPLFLTDLAGGLVGQNGRGPALGQPFDLQGFRCLQEVLKMFLGDLDFAMVHEFEDRVEVVLGDVS